METIDKTAPATQQPDQNTTSLDLMNRMKMHGMAEAFRESLAGTTAQARASWHAPWDTRHANGAYAPCMPTPPNCSDSSR